MDQFEVVYLSFFHLRDGSLLIAGGWGTEDFGRDHMIFRTIVGSQLNFIVQQHTPPPPEVKLCPELGIQCDTVTSERYGWVSTKTEGGGRERGGVNSSNSRLVGMCIRIRWHF